MEEVLYSGGGGLGMILDQNEIEEDFILPVSVEVVEETIEPGALTTLSDYFIKEVKYVGVLKDSRLNCMVFYTGEEVSLFDRKRFYYCIYLIDKYRIVNSFSYNSARDFNWNGKQWK